MSAINLPVNEPGSSVAVGLSLVAALVCVEGFVNVGELVPGPFAVLSSELNASTMPIPAATNSSTAPTAAMGIHGSCQLNGANGKQQGPWD